jgi:hypothetical protein
MRESGCQTEQDVWLLLLVEAIRPGLAAGSNGPVLRYGMRANFLA